MTHPDLAQLESTFADELPTKKLAPSDNAPLGQLAVSADPDEEGRERTLYVLLQPPGNAKDLYDNYSLQIFALLPFKAQGTHLSILARVLLLINNAIPLVGFGLNESDAQVFFRCVLPVAQNRALDPNEIFQAVWLVISCLDHFGSTIEHVIEGDMDYDQAETAVRKTLTALHKMAAD